MPPRLHYQPYARKKRKDKKPMSRASTPPPDSASDPLLPLLQGNRSEHGHALVLLPVRVPLCGRRASQAHPGRGRQPQRPQPGARLPRLGAAEYVPRREAPPRRRRGPGGEDHGAGVDCLLLPARGIHCETEFPVRIIVCPPSHTTEVVVVWHTEFLIATHLSAPSPHRPGGWPRSWPRASRRPSCTRRRRESPRR